MDSLQTNLPQSLSILPGYKPFLQFKYAQKLMALQLFLCISASIMLAYFLFKKYHCFGDNSWKKVTEIMGPIGNRLHNLEKEKLIWSSYLEWIEDYCSVYYSLLDYLNTTVYDFDMFQREGFCSKNFIQSTASSLSEIVSLSKEECRYTSNIQFSKSEENVELLSNLERMLMKVQNIMNEKQGDGDMTKKGSKEKTSGIETHTPESTERKPESKEKVRTNEKTDQHAKGVEDHLEMLFLEKKNVCSEYRELYPVYEGQSLDL